MQPFLFMDKKKAESIGYGILAKFFRKLSHRIQLISRRLAKKSDQLYFEQFRIEFGEREDDIHIVTYPKSGTTLTQMILYHLTTDGYMDFEHIYEVSPWIRNDSFRKKKPRQLPSPRIIKSHDFYTTFPKSTKGKFIFILRNGMDVAYSHYNQNKNYNNPNLKFEKFAESFLKSKAWFKFCKKWLENKYKFPVLYLRYEDLLANKEEEIEKICKFLAINPTEEQKQNALHYSSFEYMKAHEVKFGDQEPEPTNKVYDQFIRKGKTGDGKKAFSSEQLAQFDQHYKKMVLPLEQKVYNSK